MKNMEIAMRLKSPIILLILLFCIYGCERDTSIMDDSDVPLRIEFRLAPGAQAQCNITAIELTVSAPDMDEPRLFRITDINREERTARELITVPAVENMTFSVDAFEGDCRTFSGLLESVNISPDVDAPIEILLTPIPIVIGIRAEQDQLSVGAPCKVEIYIENAPALFALTCELEFDPNLLQPQEIISGGFFGTDVLFIEDSEFPRREENRLALGITHKTDAAGDVIVDVTGSCGSGTVFEITFGTIATGNAAIALLENITLTTPAFEQIDVPSRVNIEPNASVKIE